MSTKFPYAIDDSTSLLDAKDNVQTNLLGDITVDSTTIYCVDTTQFSDNGVATLHNKKFTRWEKFYYTHKTEHTFEGITRLTPQAWSVHDVIFISALISEDYHNYLRDAIIEVEKKVFNYDSTSTDIQIDVPTGITKYQDSVIGNKWISTFRQTFSFTRGRPNLGSQYLKYGENPSAVSGPRLIRDATITSISIQAKDPCNAYFKIRKNNSLTDVYSLLVSGFSGYDVDLISIDIDKGDFIQLYMEVTSGVVNYPTVVIEYAYRF